MSKTLAVWNTCAHLARQLIAVLFFAFTLAGCDGGLFGTGDGSDINVELDSGDAASTEDMQAIDPGNAGGDMALPPGAETVDADNPVTDISLQPQELDFSNTTPSGLGTQEAFLPALKVINLSSFSLSAEANPQMPAASTVQVPAAQTSDLLSVNTGESTVIISNTNDGVILATLSPLNAVQDSITTLLVTNNSADNDNEAVKLDVFDTRARVSAPAMSEVRVISVAGAENAHSDSIRLTPDSNNSEGVELVFPLNTDNSQSSFAYSLASPGRYTLSDSAELLSPQQIDLLSDAVYTIILTDNPEQPVYVEIDSRTP